MTYCPYCMSAFSEERVCPACGRLPESYAAAPHQLPAGTILAGRYLLGRVLGEGGFGITYLAFDLKEGRKVGIKEHFPRDKVRRMDMGATVLDTHGGADPDAFRNGKDRFIGEARTLAAVSHVPQIIRVLDCFETNNTAYIVMEYVEGITLTQWVQRSGGRISARELLPMMEGLFTALQQIHEKGLIHRDISPDNVMLENGKLRLLDFGVAREVGRRTETLTMTLRHGYAPVEQYQPMGQGPWTDVYALSATVYFCLTGRKPPHALERLCEDKLVTPIRAGADLSPKQEQVLLYGMGVRPRRRFQSVEAMAKELYKA